MACAPLVPVVCTALHYHSASLALPIAAWAAKNPHPSVRVFRAHFFVLFGSSPLQLSACVVLCALSRSHIAASPNRSFPAVHPANFSLGLAAAIPHCSALGSHALSQPPPPSRPLQAHFLQLTHLSQTNRHMSIAYLLTWRFHAHVCLGLTRSVAEIWWSTVASQPAKLWGTFGPEFAPVDQRQPPESCPQDELARLHNSRNHSVGALRMAPRTATPKRLCSLPEPAEMFPQFQSDQGGHIRPSLEQ